GAPATPRAGSGVTGVSVKKGGVGAAGRSPRLLASGRRVLPAEAVDAAGDVQDLVLARVERVAGGAHVGGEAAAGGAGLYDGAARAGDRGGLVLGVDAGLHGESFGCCEGRRL